MRNLNHILWLGLKELMSLLRDPVLLFLIIYSFTFSVYTPAKSAVMDVVNASIGGVGGDSSVLSRRITESFLPPLFLTPHQIVFGDINQAMNTGKYTFIV